MRLEYRNYKSLEKEKLRIKQREKLSKSIDFKKQLQSPPVYFDYTSKIVSKVYKKQKNVDNTFNPMMLGLNINKNIITKEMDLLMREVMSFQNVRKKINNNFKNQT